MQKHYFYFYVGDESYVIMIKIKGSLKWNDQYRCFMDNLLYVRGCDDVVAMAIRKIKDVPNYEVHSFKINHKNFVAYRAQGIKRFQNGFIDWD